MLEVYNNESSEDSDNDLATLVRWEMERLAYATMERKHSILKNNDWKCIYLWNSIVELILILFRLLTFSKKVNFVT